MGSRRSFKVTKTKKLFSKKQKLATIFEDIPSSHLCDPAIPYPTSKLSFDELISVLSPRPDICTFQQESAISLTIEGERVASPHRPALNTFFYHNGIHFTLEECQLICSLQGLSADDDLVSEIIKHERGSPDPVNCAGLDRHLLDPNFVTTKDQVVLPILANIEAARVKAQKAYNEWMVYMTGVVWGYQLRCRDDELLNMAPFPCRWINLVPSRLLYGEVNDITYSWNEPGWDIGAPFNMEAIWE